MRWNYRSRPRLLIGVLRFYLLKLLKAGKLKTNGPGYLGKGVGFFIEKKGSVELEGKIAVNDFANIYSEGKLRIGKNFYMNRFSSLFVFEQITIGDNVSIGQYSSVLDHDHAYQKGADENITFDGYHTSPVSIGNNVWIANHCSVLRGVSIGNNVVVGANTLVHKDVPDNCIILGVPYKIIKKI